MRQFVLGLLAAGLAWWGYGKWIAVDDAHAAGGQTPNGVAGGQLNGGQLTGGKLNGTGALDQMLGTGGQPAKGDEQPLEANPVVNPDADKLKADIDKLLPLVANGDEQAISLAWAAVATGNLGREHGRVVAALQPRGDDFNSQLKALGANNAFLHSVPGRAAAEKVMAVAMAMPDEQAVKAGSLVLKLMVSGRIQRGDLPVRAAVDKAYGQHRIRVDRHTCSPGNVAGARSYTVKPGNSLDVIARKFRREGIKVEAGTIALLNRISNPNLLRAGQQLKIPVDPVHALLEKRSFALMVFVGNEMLRLYWVGHGTNDRTPLVEFEVIAKQEKPDWTAPDGNVYAYGRKENILGEYFIKFGHKQFTGFGAHGTPMKETICTMSSMGCIRMFDQNIAELFRILPRGAKVRVQATESVR